MGRKSTWSTKKYNKRVNNKITQNPRPYLMEQSVRPLQCVICTYRDAWYTWYSELYVCTQMRTGQGAVSIIKTVLLGMVIPMLKIRRPTGRLIFNMGIPIPGKTVFYIETRQNSKWHIELISMKLYVYSKLHYFISHWEIVAAALIVYIWHHLVNDTIRSSSKVMLQDLFDDESTLF